MFTSTIIMTFLSLLMTVSQCALGLPHETVKAIYRRALQAETLDGSPLDPMVVDFLDQLEVTQNAVNNTTPGTAQHDSLVQELDAVSSILTGLMNGYATLVTDQPTVTSTIANPAATPAPTDPVIVTVIPQGNPSFVVLASQGTTTTIIRTITANPTATAASGDAEEEQIPRSLTTKGGPVQTALGSSSDGSNVPSNDARCSPTLSRTLLLIPVGLLGALMSVM